MTSWSSTAAAAAAAAAAAGINAAGGCVHCSTYALATSHHSL